MKNGSSNKFNNSTIRPAGRENVIKFDGATFPWLARKFLESTRHIIEFRGFNNIELDFSNIESCFSESMLPLLATISHYRSEGVCFRAIAPEKPSLHRTFLSSNWLHIIDPRNFSESTDDRDGRFYTRMFMTPTDQKKIIDGIMDSILRTTNLENRESLTALEWAINEIVDNVITHSESDVPGFIQLTHLDERGELEFVVSDAGIGIPNSLRSGPYPNLSDAQALEESVKEGVTRGTGQGNGLYGSMRIAQVSGGSFGINSGHAYLSLTRDGALSYKEIVEDIIGCSVHCCINYRKPNILEKALSFRGISHDPLDIIDFKYESDADQIIVFSMNNETNTVGNRISGRECRQKLKNLLRLSRGNRILLDFAGVGLMSSSFADEFLVVLVKEIGIEEFKSSFFIRNIGETNVSILDRSSFQRNGFFMSEFIDLGSPTQ